MTGVINPGIDVSDSNGLPASSDLVKLSTTLTIARDSVLAADCCIALLASDRLPKQVFEATLAKTIIC